MWRYKIDILKELSNRGYTSTKMRKDKIMSEGTMQHIRKGHGISIDTLNTICRKDKIFLKTLKLVLTNFKTYANI